MRHFVGCLLCSLFLLLLRYSSHIEGGQDNPLPEVLLADGYRRVACVYANSQCIYEIYQLVEFVYIGRFLTFDAEFFSISAIVNFILFIRENIATMQKVQIIYHLLCVKLLVLCHKSNMFRYRCPPSYCSLLLQRYDFFLTFATFFGGFCRYNMAIYR